MFSSVRPYTSHRPPRCLSDSPLGLVWALRSSGEEMLVLNPGRSADELLSRARILLQTFVLDVSKDAAERDITYIGDDEGCPSSVLLLGQS